MILQYDNRIETCQRLYAINRCCPIKYSAIIDKLMNAIDYTGSV